MKSDLDAAIERRAKLLEEIEKINNLIELWTWWQDASALTSPSAPTSTDSSAESPSPPESGTEGGRETYASPAETVRECLSILVASERPMRRGALLAALIRRGVKVGGANKSKVLGTTLWRAKEQFVSLPGWGYWIKDRPYPPALYDPLKGSQSHADPLDDLLG